MWLDAPPGRFHLPGSVNVVKLAVVTGPTGSKRLLGPSVESTPSKRPYVPEKTVNAQPLGVGLLNPNAGSTPSDGPCVPVRASLRGVTSGIRRTCSLGPSGTCWVFVDGYNWDVLLSLLGSPSLDITQVFVKEPEDSYGVPTAVNKLVGKLAIPVASWNLDLARSLQPSHICVMSYRASYLLMEDLSSVGITAVLTTRRFRRLPRHWRLSRLQPFTQASLG